MANRCNGVVEGEWSKCEESDGFEVGYYDMGKNLYANKLNLWHTLSAMAIFCMCVSSN